MSEDSEYQTISIRLPKLSLSILKEFAARENVGYQVLLKRWLDEKLAEENRLYLDGSAALRDGLTPGKPLRMPKTDIAGPVHYAYDQELET